MKWLRVKNNPDILKGTFRLPASKSISNRALMIKALSYQPFTIYNLSVADDTLLMHQLFENDEHELYVKNAGTVMRFLTAYYAAKPGCEVVLKGNDRMNGRPISFLVEALRALGADIAYLDKENHPPILIKGKNLKGGAVSIPAHVSSQFASALLLIAPALKEGLILTLEGQIASEPYIQLTLDMLSYFGIRHSRKGNIIQLDHHPYIPKDLFVEADWSSASYVYAMAALLPGSKVELSFLFEQSWQGDHVLSSLFRHLGVKTEFKDRLAHINSEYHINHFFEFNFLPYPDLIPTFACYCCAAGIPFAIHGISTLQHKESDRARVLEQELQKLGHDIRIDGDSLLYTGKSLFQHEEVFLETYDDHRMAMSFFLLAMQNDSIWIADPDCVEKSFPAFWQELENAGFEFDYRT
jgi:3-phosphoshikimate 1-carboxyvinyltransferase